MDAFANDGEVGATAGIGHGCKWMHFPRSGIALLRMASLDRFDEHFRDRLEMAVPEGGFERR